MMFMVTVYIAVTCNPVMLGMVLTLTASVIKLSRKQVLPNTIWPSDEYGRFSREMSQHRSFQHNVYYCEPIIKAHVAMYLDKIIW